MLLHEFNWKKEVLRGGELVACTDCLDVQLGRCHRLDGNSL